MGAYTHQLERKMRKYRSTRNAHTVMNQIVMRHTFIINALTSTMTNTCI